MMQVARGKNKFNESNLSSSIKWKRLIEKYLYSNYWRFLSDCLKNWSVFKKGMSQTLWYDDGRISNIYEWN